MCEYFLETGELRAGKPKGDYCPNYKKKEEQTKGAEE